MTLASGTRLAAYEITSAIGAGGLAKAMHQGVGLESERLRAGLGVTWIR